MTSYMNPSKKVTDLLSTYLEFDPEQLKLGIWSGNLTLKDVNLREEAIYPHLNTILNRKDVEVHDRMKPPLRMKLLQGSIGELSMKIPWKSLVWGQDDVQVDARNIVITLALESREETRKREANGEPDAETIFDNKNSNRDDKPTQFRRDVKQRLIKESEKRLMAGRNVTGWLRKNLKAEEEKHQKALLSRDNLVKDESRVEKWLKGTTSDFFWRFYTGLQMKIENLKIVIVQDGIEVGVIMPSIQVLAGVSEKKNPGSQGERAENVTLDSNSTPPGDVVYESAYEDGEHVDKRVVYKSIGVYVRHAASPDKLSARGHMIHVNDVTTNEFIIRPFDFEFSYSLFFPYPPEKRKKKKQAKLEAAKPPVPSADEARSVDGSLSTTTSKKRRGKRDKVRVPPPKEEASVAPTETTAATSIPHSTPPPPAPATKREQTQASISTVKRAVRRASMQAAGFAALPPPAPTPETEPVTIDATSAIATPAAPAAIQQAPTTQKRHARRSSLAAPLMGSETVAAKVAVSATPPKEKIRRQTSAPLALPEQVKQQYAASVENDELATRFDSRLHISAIKVVFSSTQYHLLDLFLASSSRMRNGRPPLTIGTVIEGNIGIHRALSLMYSVGTDVSRKGGSADSVDASASNSRFGHKTRGSAQLQIESGSAASIRSSIIRSWWYYAFDAVVWELRQRKRLKRMFQERFLSFNWDRQNYRRAEYVALFIATNLSSQTGTDSPISSSLHGRDRAKLLGLEDELHVEQVLLYRAFARAVHVAGMTEMPGSILDINMRQDKRRLRRELQYSVSGSSADDHPIKRPTKENGYDYQPWMNMPMVLSASGRRCEVSRRRLGTGHDEFLQQGEPFSKFYTMSRRRGVEESTVGMTIDTRATKMSRKTRAVQNEQTSSMKFSFTATLSKIEFLLIEDESSQDHHSTVSSVEGTDVSGLTDDIRGWDEEEDEDEMFGKVEDVSSGPIMNSTDFLLFKDPETTLLHIVVTGMGCSALGRSGGSRNLNVKVRSVDWTGYDGCHLLSIGSKVDDSAASVAEVAVMGEPHTTVIGDDTQNALCFGLVVQDEERYIQCDSARIKTCVDINAVARIMKFPLSSPASYPSNVLPRSGREEVLLHVLNQNAAPNSFIFIDSSVRIQGVDLLFPNVNEPPQIKEARNDFDNSWGSGRESFMVAKGQEGACFRVDMVEFYSGSTVASLTGSSEKFQKGQSSARTRKLKMLDLEMFEDGNASLLSYDWIVAASGLDFEVLHVAVEGEVPRSTSFLDSPIEVEVFGTTNSGSIRDFTRAKREVIVEVSPVDVRVSENRLRLLSKAVPKDMSFPSRPQPESPCQPRLDVLSRSLLYVADVSFARVRMSLVTDEEGRVGVAVLSKYAQFEEFVGDFLNVVKDFDLGWPNGEALSAGMQICIDRLAGIGFGVEDGWQCANTALLNFLEDMANTEAPGANETADDVDLAEEKVRLAVSRTAEAFARRLNEPLDGLGGVEHHLVFDMPSGFCLSCVKLYYDFHCMVNFPSAFITNGEGIHILRLTPEVDAEQEEGALQEEQDTRSDALASKSSTSKPPAAAASAKLYHVDSDALFGKGGKSLSILGEDDIKDERIVESLVDVEVGDVEVLFCQDVFDDLLETLSDFVPPFCACIPTMKKTREGPATSEVNEKYRRHLMCSTTALSALFSSDRFVPFCRFILNDCVCTVGHRGEQRTTGTKASAKSLSLLNLTSAGQLHPEPISVPPASLGLPILVTMDRNGDQSQLRMDFRHVRILFLRQFLNECLQFFYYSDYGIGLFGTRMKEILEAANGPAKNKGGNSRFSMHFHDCSVILPRDNESSDMLAVEVTEASVFTSRPIRSFIMPTEQDNMDIGPLVPAMESDGIIGSDSETISRIAVSLRDFRIFTSIGERSDDDGGTATVESPAFGFFFGIDGRAEGGKPVYLKLASLGAQAAEDEAYWTNTEKAQRRWSEATCNPVSLDIVIDYAPHMRILITDPLDNPHNRVALDVSVAQFCLLLTVWYGNMQQMPVLFPFSPEDFERNARGLSVLEKFPFYGTQDLVEILASTPGISSETAIRFSDMSLACRQDTSESDDSVIVLSFGGATIHIVSDTQGVTRIGAGSLSCSLLDSSKCFKDVIKVENTNNRTFSFADHAFGVRENVSRLENDFPLGFQLSILIGPEWSVYNLGMQCPDLVMSDFRTIFRFLDFVTVYFADESFGNPSFKALARVNEIKEELMQAAQKSNQELEEPISIIDFRCWLRRPRLKIPYAPKSPTSDFSIIESTEGFWYRFSGADTFSSQECVGRGMSLSFEDRANVDMNSAPPSVFLIEGLSFGLRISYHGEGDHTDISMQIPYTDDDACSLTSPGVFVQPRVVPSPTVCVPHKKPLRHMGPTVCEMTCVVDVLPRAWTSVYGLFTTEVDMIEADPSPDEESDDENKGDDEGDGTSTKTEAQSTMSFTAGVGDLRVLVLDPVLGPHLPVTVVNIAELRITTSAFGDQAEDLSALRGQAPLNDLQVLVEGNVWADYFKFGLTRSWEPLLEAYLFSVLFERSIYRGVGVTVSSDVPFHVNVSGALLLILDECFDAFNSSIQEAMGRSKNPIHRKRLSNNPESHLKRIEDFEGLAVAHTRPTPLGDSERVAFSLKNMTGQMIRAFRIGGKTSFTDDGKAVMNYLDNTEAIELSLLPSVSLVKNLAVVEVAYPGLENSPRSMWQKEIGTSHQFDLQLPGFAWIRNLKIDQFGRRFIDLVPRCTVVKEKLRDDWRLANVMKLLVEVGLERGGREVAIRSPFSIQNMTSHTLRVRLHVDATQRGTKGDGDEDMTIYAGESFPVPIVLLENALRKAGSHLGSFWLRPDIETLQDVFTSENIDTKDLSVNLSTSPVQLAKVVGETSAIFTNHKSDDTVLANATSGVTLSCPVLGSSDDREVAPFCYAVEIMRSPLVRVRHPGTTRKGRREEHQHGAVAYTINVHAPIVLVNLLPERGRFEIMHAVRRTVLWFADLEPGQQVPVHSVGLDAPLLLFINLRFCCTPVGDGALIHHGTEMSNENRDHMAGLKKAGMAVTKQLGKTLTSLGESPDKRGLQKIQQARDTGSVVTRAAHSVGVSNPLGLDTDSTGVSEAEGQTYRVDTAVFLPGDCDTETDVVDRVGQRLTLQIENIRGGGGQRRISVFSPFWIVNSTEHSLRYKQDKSTQFVSGTVLSPDKDGSTPVDGGKAGWIDIARSQNGDIQPLNRGTIFAGTPGALATSIGRCSLSPEELASIVDKNMPLDQMAKLAFMYNFHEGALSMGGQKLCIQLYDGTGQSKYQSDWSRGFSLGSVGFSQVVDMQCADGRALELTVVVQTAPGFLSGYTKVVRILPRYIAVNSLPYPIRLWQDNSSFRPPAVDAVGEGAGKWRLGQQRAGRNDHKKVNQYESLWGREVNLAVEEQPGQAPRGTTARQTALYIGSLPIGAWRPFTLPDSRGDRQLRVGQGAYWNMTSSVSTDVPGDHTLRMARSTDIRLLKHVSTRASPQYNVVLPPSGENSFDEELGIWFETEWGSDRSLLVKAVKRGSYCFNKTDVRVGDELLAIDGAPVIRMSFADAMGILRGRLTEIKTSNPPELRQRMSRRSVSLRFGSKVSRQDSQNETESEENLFPVRTLTLTFRTAEERLRKVRRKAAKSRGRGPSEDKTSRLDGQQLEAPPDDSKFISLELRPIHNIMFLHIRDAVSIPYEIQNRSRSTTIYFRQRGCSSHPWRCLKPGASEAYTWEEPLKSKRLSLRVATANAFGFATGVDVSEEVDPPSSRGLLEAEKDPEILKQSRKKAYRKARDEEETVFSPSVNIRLDEIGYRDVLQLQPTSDQPWAHRQSIEMEVGVIGATRVLVVQDISKNEGEDLLRKHLDVLHVKAGVEERRLSELRSVVRAVTHSRAANPIQLPNNDHTRDMVEAAKSLMHDFPEERTISGTHQLVIEVLEAVGLSPDSYIGVCNPYVEVSLCSTTAGRRSLFTKNVDARRTYFVRKSVNPSWNAQSFIFDVPEEAESIPRGHSLKIKVRNFRKVGTHSTLGRAQVDLNSVRNQKPLIGWFPLAGRTGRRELETSTSHWGRGSIRLKVQWIYTDLALLNYFILLSETKLSDLKESIKGMGTQLEQKREEDQKELDQIDGFRAVRLNNLVENRKKSSDHPEIRDSGVLRIFQPVFSRAKKSLAMVTDALPSTQLQLGGAKAKNPLPPALAFSSKSHSSQRRTSASAGQLEDMIVKKRHELQTGLLSQMLDRKREQAMRNYASSGNFPLSTFKSWVDAQRLVNDKDFDVVIEGDSLQVRLDPCWRRKKVAKENGSDEMTPGISCIISPPLLSPSTFVNSKAYSARFCDSRRNFERYARCALRVALNPGGWLTVRPIQAKNLPDSSSGMSVKVQYDSKSQSTETVDSTVSPTWFKGHGDIPDSPRADAMEYLPGDLHFYIPPQRTNGSLRLSVNAESRHQGIATKTEIGMLQIPLGGAIGACVNAVEDFLAQSSGQSEANSPIYIRWFPLKQPQDDVPVEGDQLFGKQPSESEKTGSDQFIEYFTPCIQLGLIWSPEVARESNEMNRQESMEDDDHHLRPGGVFSSQVQRYFNADISQISFALIDSQRSTELLSCTFTDVDVRHWVTKAKSRYGIAVGWFQFDQQNDSAREPVVLAPTQKGALVPVVQVLAVKDNMRSKSEVLSFDFIDMSISEFDLSIEERFLFQLYDFFASLRLRARAKKPGSQQAMRIDASEFSPDDSSRLYDEDEEPPLFAAVGVLGSGEKADQRVYIQQLGLGVLKFNISYFKGKKEIKKTFEMNDWAESPVTTVVVHDESDAFRRWSQNTSNDEAVINFLGKGGSSLPSLIASLFPNVSDAPVRLQAKSLNHVFYSPTEIVLYIMGFYQTEILRQIYKIIGSLDFVGNPTMVLNSFISGFRDLIVTPSVALMRSPTDPSRVGLGVAKGTLSLFSHSTSGFFGSLSKVSAAAGQGLATLSLDKKYRSWHREAVLSEASNLNRSWKRRGVQNAGKMIVRPVADIAVGLTSGVAGLIIAPISGFKKGGGKGFAFGVVSGMAGFLVKPTVGVLDALSHFTGSIHDIARSVNVLEKRVQPTIRYRLPYVFGTHRVLTPYDDNKARATQLLRLFPVKKRRGIQTPIEIVIHVEVLPNLGVDTYGIVTNLRLILLRVKKEQSGSLATSFCWQVSLVGDSAISSEVSGHGHNGVALTINVKKTPKPSESESVLDDAAALLSVSVDDNLGFDSGTNVSDIEGEMDHGHGTSRGKEGELLEWFTVVAEYQHRRQLCRLHNAVSCISGNLDAVIRDRPLGRVGSSEGYTSFGIFHFDEKESGQSQLNTPGNIQESFDLLPWCEKFVTSGPKWLNEAQETAYNTVEDIEWATLSSQEPDQGVSTATEGKKSARRLTRWLVGRLPTIHDADSEDLSYETPVKFVTTTPIPSSDDEGELAESNELTISNTSLVQSQGINASTDTDTSDFESCRSSVDSSDGIGLVPLEQQSRVRRKGRRLRRNHSEGDTEPLRDSSFSPVQPNALLESQLSRQHHNVAARHSADSSDDEMHDTRSRISAVRMERMEALMEQLVIFSTEQALSQARGHGSRAGGSSHAGSVSEDDMWEEIQLLRKQVRAQARKETQSITQIEGLRAELADLRQQVATSSVSAHSHSSMAAEGQGDFSVQFAEEVTEIDEEEEEEGGGAGNDDDREKKREE